MSKFLRKCEKLFSVEGMNLYAIASMLNNNKF